LQRIFTGSQKILQGGEEKGFAIYNKYLYLLEQKIMPTKKTSKNHAKKKNSKYHANKKDQQKACQEKVRANIMPRKKTAKSQKRQRLCVT